MFTVFTSYFLRKMGRCVWKTKQKISAYILILIWYQSLISKISKILFSVKAIFIKNVIKFILATHCNFCSPSSISTSQIRRQAPQPWQISTLCKKSWAGLNYRVGGIKILFIWFMALQITATWWTDIRESVGEGEYGDTNDDVHCVRWILLNSVVVTCHEM